MSKAIAVIGGGAWGSAMASSLGAHHDVRILTRRDDLASALMEGVSPCLDGIRITPPSIASTDAEAVLNGAQAVIVAVPVAATAGSLEQIKPHLPKDIPLAFAAKGLEASEGELICEFAARKITAPIVMLSGPSFADEVAMGKPAALVSASHEDSARRHIAELFTNSNIRVYKSDDPIGVAAGGAIKNVIAIACGIIEGLNFGDNARAALLTRGLVEATRFAVALGGRKETLFGLSGLGDMSLTCSGVHSRNFAYGLALGRGEVPSAKLAEGQYSCRVIAGRAAQAKVEVPIIEAVARVVAGEAEIEAEINQLLLRPVHDEWAE